MNVPTSKKRDSKNWSAWRTANYEYFHDKLSTLPHTYRLLDLGAGDIQFADLFFPFTYTGVDFKPYPNVTVVADLTKPIPLPDASADVIVLSNTLEHIPNTKQLLSEAFRLLSSGGRIIGTIPFLVGVHQAPYDFNRYTNYALKDFLSQAGFVNVSVEPLGSLIDTYDTMERKFFDASGYYPIRMWRRFEMYLLRLLIKTPATAKYTEGYGFTAIKL